MGLQKFNEEIHKTQQFRSEDRGKCSTCEEELLWTAVIKVRTGAHVRTGKFRHAYSYELRLINAKIDIEIIAFKNDIQI